MLKRYQIIIIILLLLQACTHDNPVNPEPPELNDLSDIEALMNYSLIPGVSIAIINNFKIDTLIALGVKDNQTKEPMTVNTLLMAGSISKPIASMCAMSFVQRGDIKLNDNVNVVLQSWKMPDNEFTVNQKVTLHRLLSHRAGTIEGSYQYSNDEPIPTLLQVLNGVSPAVNPPVEITFVPGSEFIYSNLGYCVVEQILTDITGKPFYEIVKQTVFDPLDMNNSSFEQLLPAQRENNYSSGHYTIGNVVPGKYMITSTIAAGGIWTTAEDLAKFIIEAQLSFKSQSNKILSKQYMDIWDTPVTQISLEMSENYALGISNYSVGGYAYFGHGGSIDGFSGKIFASKNYGYGVVVLTNYNNSNEFPKKIIDLVAKLYGWKGF